MEHLSSDKLIVELIQSQAVESLGTFCSREAGNVKGKGFQLANCSLAVSPVKAAYFPV